MRASRSHSGAQSRSGARSRWATGATRRRRQGPRAGGCQAATAAGECIILSAAVAVVAAVAAGITTRRRPPRRGARHLRGAGHQRRRRGARGGTRGCSERGWGGGVCARRGGGGGWVLAMAGLLALLGEQCTQPCICARGDAARPSTGGITQLCTGMESRHTRPTHTRTARSPQATPQPTPLPSRRCTSLLRRRHSLHRCRCVPAAALAEPELAAAKYHTHDH